VRLRQSDLISMATQKRVNTMDGRTRSAFVGLLLAVVLVVLYFMFVGRPIWAPLTSFETDYVSGPRPKPGSSYHEREVWAHAHPNQSTRV